MKTRLDEIWERAREIMAPNCKVCPVCDGKACRGQVPGMGGAGDGGAWTACVDYLKSVKLNLDTIYEYHGTDSSFKLFGKTYAAPIFAAPMGVALNTNKYLTEEQHAHSIVTGSLAAGILPFTGDGNDPMWLAGLAEGKAVGGQFVPTMKPWRPDLLRERIRAALEASPLAAAMDIDAAGFVNMGKDVDKVGPRSVDELREAVALLQGVPLILKGVMTARGAEKAADAGCAGIIVSTHGGRVITSAPSTCEVLPEIRAAVGGRMKIFVDGGIRSGADIFKALALGADACMIGRPFIIAAQGGGAEGVQLYAEKLTAELQHTMKLCGASTLADINRDMVRA